MADGARGGLILIKAGAQASRHFSRMVTRFPTGREPHKPAAAPQPAPAPKAAEAAKPKSDGCCCGGNCGGADKAKS